MLLLAYNYAKNKSNKTYLRHSGDADTIRWIFKLFSLRIVRLQQETTAKFQVCNKLRHYWPHDRRNIWSIKTSALKLELISGGGYSLKYLSATPPAYFKNVMKSFVLYAPRMLGIKLTGDWESREKQMLKRWVCVYGIPHSDDIKEIDVKALSTRLSRWRACSLRPRSK